MTSKTPSAWLGRARALRVKLWRYRPEVDPSQAQHIGPMAEDWHAITGFGDGRTIDLLDAFGVLLKATQELADQVDELRAKLNEQSERRAGRDTSADQHELFI